MRKLSLASMMLSATAACTLAACATGGGTTVTLDELAIIKASFNEQGQAKLDRLDRDEAQRLCSIPPTEKLDKAAATRIENANLAAIKYPADGKFMGDWRAGERIAQTGVGKQFSDNPKVPSGGNCYACHQLSKAEISFGTIGPSLYNYGKLRGGASAELQKYTYGRIYNPQAYSACSNMPRFGHNGILTEQQIKDVTALLLDSKSPVNQ